MCQKCKSNSCSGCSSDSQTIAQLQNELVELSNLVNDLNDVTKAFRLGHPIWEIDDPDDIAMFDTTTGLGFDNWEGWALCTGATHYSLTAKKNITTPNLLNMFIVAAGDDYSVGDTGGANTVTLNISQMPSHDHTLNDSGHTHAITDGGHTHGITQSPHTHSASGGTHSHDFDGTTNSTGAHEHSTGSVIVGDGGDDVNVRLANADAGSSTSTEGIHSHTFSGETASAAVAVTVNSASISISNQSASTGISNQEAFTGITMDAEGGGTAHENRPPYYALIFVKRIG